MAPALHSCRRSPSALGGRQRPVLRAAAPNGSKRPLIVLAYRIGARIAQLLPERVALGAAMAVGSTVPLLARKRAAQVARHQHRINPLLAAAGPAMRRQVRRTFASYARSVVDSFRLPAVTPAQLAQRFEIEGWEHVEAGLAAGKGVIMAMPHLGAWDYGGAWFASRKPLTVVAEALEPPELFAWFVDHRKRLGLTVVPLGPEAGAPLLAALRRNESLGLLCDRDIGGGGVEVTFFGERTTMPAGPATFALRTGAVLLPNAAVYTAGHRIRGIVRPPIVYARTGRLRDDVAALTQLLAHELEALIRTYPEQWHVLQPNWRSDRVT